MARKMLLVPPEFVNSQNKVLAPQVNKLSQLDDSVKTILELENLPDDLKVKLYNDALDKFTKRRELFNSASVPEQKAVARHAYVLENDIVRSVPANLRKKAGLLIDRLKNSREISWDDSTGEVEIGGERIVNSHIQDLVNDAMRKRKGVTPNGWEQFYHELSKMNIPQDLVPNPERWSYIQKGKSPSNLRLNRSNSFKWKPYD